MFFSSSAAQTGLFFTARFFYGCFLLLLLGSFLISCGCSTAKSKTPPQETLFYPLNGTEHGSQPSVNTRDRELVFVLEDRIEPGDLNPRPLTPQSVTLPTLPRVGLKKIFTNKNIFSEGNLYVLFKTFFSKVHNKNQFFMPLRSS